MTKKCKTGIIHNGKCITKARVINPTTIKAFQKSFRKYSRETGVSVAIFPQNEVLSRWDTMGGASIRWNNPILEIDGHGNRFMSEREAKESLEYAWEQRIEQERIERFYIHR